ncbi:hypothetical protein RMATCC62417_04218 [Rhizopus microsporus]|nr:hypothetical protein RMATCC62417_04218 [Rhizopus microsporus]
MTKKRGPPKGYIEAIENRLYKLENFLAELAKSGDIQSSHLLMELNSPLETPTGEQIRARPVRRVPKSERSKVFFWQQDKAGKRKRESLLSDSDTKDYQQQEQDLSSREESMDEGVGQLAMDENGQVRYLGKSSGYYLLQSSRTYQNGAFHFANYGKKRKRIPPLQPVDPLELPPKDLSEHLIILYFRYFYPFLPLFFRRQLFSAVEPGVTPLLLNSIYAVASRISPDVRVRSDPASPDTAGDIFFERAERLLDESYDKPSISTVQSLLLLASHQHGAMRSARAWLYSGMAFRMAQDLGLHRNCDHWNIPPEERERRKRVFWCCYIVDRLGSAMYGRATTFEEKDCDVPFPSVDDHNLLSSDGEPVRLLDNFINLIKICDILGHVLKCIYYVRSLQNTEAKQADSVLTTLNKRLHQWYDQLPSSLRIKNDKSGKSPSVAVCQLHLIYYTTVILLHRPFIPGPDQSVSVPSLLPCASICASAADSILSITTYMLEHNQLKYVWNFAVYYIFSAGIIYIKDANDGNSDKLMEARMKVNKCMQALDEIESTWVTASKRCQIIAELTGLQDPNLGNDDRVNSISSWQPHELYSGRIGSTAVKSEEYDDRKSLYTTNNADFVNLPNPYQPQRINSTTMDPFAAPGIIPVDNNINNSKQYDTSSYWESSLDDWDQFQSSHHEAALVTSAPSVSHYQEKQHLIHTDQNVDVLSGVPLPWETTPSSAANNKTSGSFINYLQSNNENDRSSADGGPSNNNNNSTLKDLANAYYW